MADLREQLLKAGLIDKKSKQEADTADRRKKKKKKKKKKRDATPSADAARQQAWEQKMAAQAEENRRREAERHADREAREHRNRLANLIDSAALHDLKEGNRRWCYVTREHQIRWLWVTAEIAWKLQLGALALVDHPAEPEEPPRLVPRDAAERIATLDADAIRCWNRDGSDEKPER